MLPPLAELSTVSAELEPNKLARFLRRVEDGYNDTPYHSKTHAADVLQSMHCIMTLGGLVSRMDDELVMLAGEPAPPMAVPELLQSR